MEKYAHLQTGVGTSTTGSMYFGPFELQQDADAFIEKAQAKFGELGGNTSPMAISLVDELPEGRGAVAPEILERFVRA